ncbi:S8 family serine peptidase [Dokdonella sp.]|uniref:S8 family serine peptidase n=1 Tax=Dokdonella sp. TaxID=2291710 RepID=UPI0031BDA77B|nr:S8 family serine peptidase [Dokdonella sp.]
MRHPRPAFTPAIRSTPLAAALGLALCLGLGISAPACADVVSGAAGTGEEASGPARYTIVFKGAPLAAYQGEVAGFDAPPRIARGANHARLDVHAPAARTWVAHLRQQQQASLRAIESLLGRPLPVLASMQHALNAVVVELSAHEAARVAQRADVDFVEREHQLELLTSRSPAFIGAPSIWDGSAAAGVASQGEGVVVGVLDTGINWQSPAFAAVGPIDGHVHVNPNGAGNYLGLCGPTPPNADLGRCNDKLIGMYDFTSTSPGRSATDLNGHGSHTASTAAGNFWDAPFGGGNFRLSGVAPHANVVAFRVCTTGCSTVASSQAVNQAVADGVVDVINFSISGGTSPWTDSVSVAFRNAVGAGIFVAASAGNDGPDAGSVNHVEPWVETVAASTKDEVTGFRFDVTAPGLPPPEAQHLPLRPAAPPLPTASLVDVPVVPSPTFTDGSNDGCASFPPNTFTVSGVGAVAVLALDQNASNCSSGTRRGNALAAGAIGVIFVDRDFINLGASGTSWSMLRADWEIAWTVMEVDPQGARASLLLPAVSFPQRGDVVSDYSSRGPLANGGQYLAKPNITAPGTDVLAAYRADAGGASATAMQNGTSMSGPHIAGAAALLRAVRPDWTPSEIRSAINMTARTDGLVRADGSPTDTWDLGSGRVDLERAALSGLVLDESVARFAAANPSAGGVLADLNLAEFTHGACAASCTFTRTLRSSAPTQETWLASVSGDWASAVTVVPESFSIAPGATQVIEVGIDGSRLPAGWNFAQLVLEAQAGENADELFRDGFDGPQPPPESNLPRLHLPLTIRP